MASGAQTWVGAVMGTGATLNIDKPGFSPRYVRVLNVDDPGALEWTDSMADASGLKHVDGTHTFITTLGITPRDKGFTLGADTDINVDGQLVHIACWR